MISWQLKRLPKRDEGWFRTRIIRKLSLPLTWLLLKFRFSPNTTTIAWIILGIIGSLVILIDNKYNFLIASFLLLIHYIIDFSDGEIARIKETTSKMGYILDIVGHQIVHNILIIVLVIYSDISFINSYMIKFLIVLIVSSELAQRTLIDYFKKEYNIEGVDSPTILGYSKIQFLAFIISAIVLDEYLFFYFLVGIAFFIPNPQLYFSIVLLVLTFFKFLALLKFVKIMGSGK